MVSGVWTNCKLITFTYALVLLSTFVPYEAKNAKQSQFKANFDCSLLAKTSSESEQLISELEIGD